MRLDRDSLQAGLTALTVIAVTAIAGLSVFHKIDSSDVAIISSVITGLFALARIDAGVRAPPAPPPSIPPQPTPEN